MRTIPGNTKVQIEIFKGVTLWDLLVGALAAVMLALIVVSTLPFKTVFVVLHLLVTALLLVRIDKDPTYLYLIHILRHFGFGRKFNKLESAVEIFDKKELDSWEEISDLTAFTGIDDGFIEFGKKYYGAAIEITAVDFRFFSDARRVNSIENGLGSILRAIRTDYSANIVKIERPISYDDHLKQEYDKLDELKNSYIQGFIKEDELKARIAIVYDRIYDLRNLTDKTRIVNPFYYLVLFNSDKKQLNIEVTNSIRSLKQGEIPARRLNDKELAVFLRYTNEIDFDEKEIDNIEKEDYAKWAMPEKVEFTPRNAIVNGMLTHNFRVVSYPTIVADAWLASLMTYPSTKVVIKAKPMDSGKAITAIDKSLSELRAKVSSARTDSEAMEAATHLETLQHLLSSLQGENETLLDVNIYITAYDSVETNENPKYANLEYASLRAKISSMKKVLRRAWQEAGFKLNNNEFSQAIAYVGSQISGYDPMEKKGRGIPSNTLAASYPWVFPFVMDENGVKVGISEGVPVFFDFFRRDAERVNSNIVIVGKSGSGKSFATKALLSNLAAEDSKIFILDPENEYTDLAKNLNGKYINVANAQYGRLNPFHIITTLEDDEDGEITEANSYAIHLQFLEEFFKQILPDCD
ncbi:MAG: DUF87 domain-containing protein, partial [Bacillota bacterium]|nr:DUF87 domain-containing protein [Bacillota bacterium]